MKKLKFCNIKNIFETRTAGKLGVPFLGFHMISESDFQREEELKSCVRELRNYYPRTKAVLITKEKVVERLSNLIDEFEFETVQLHYPDSAEIAKTLRGIYGHNICIIQVITPETSSLDIHNETDILLLDKSYLGGTGKQLSEYELNDLLNQINFNRVLLAGGISHTNLHQYLHLNTYGFDIQSALKSDHPSSSENTDYTRMVSITKLLGYEPKYDQNQVGFVIQDIHQQNADLLSDAVQARVDFLHIDISDGFVSNKTELSLTKQLISNIRSINTHLPIQIHLFTNSEKSTTQICDAINCSKHANLELFTHINRDNFINFSEEFIKGGDYFLAVDVKDIIDETFPWEQFIKQKLLICLQSTAHSDRVANLNRAIKMIGYATNYPPVITIDRSVDYSVVTMLERTRNINVVCGNYLADNLAKRYNLLKKYLYARR